jgi:hypothetical protein
MQRALASFFERGRFRHPRPEEFFSALGEATGRDLLPFIYAGYRSSDVFDYGVESLQSRPEGRQFRTDVVIRRLGEALFPVDVVVKYEDGSRTTGRWNGQERWTSFTFETGSRAVSAQVDPDRVLLLDINYTNNSITLDPSASEAATKWSLKWMVWLQDALLTWAFFV